MKFDVVGCQFTDPNPTNDTKAIQAIVTPTGSMTWGELRIHVEKIISHLQAAAVPRGHPVFVYGDESSEQFAALVACMVGGYPFVPIHSQAPAARMQRMREICGSRVIINAGATAPVGFDVEITHNTKNTWQKQGQFAATGADVTHPQAAYIVFTSGSTGDPKAVLITKDNLAAYMRLALRHLPPLEPQDVLVNEFAFGFDGLFIPFFYSLHSGASFLHAAAVETHSEKLAKATFWFLTPASLSKRRLNDDFNFSNYPKLHTFVLAGEVLPTALVKRVKEKFPSANLWNLYGPTETTIIISFEKVESDLLNGLPTVQIGRVNGPAPIELKELSEKHDPVLFEIYIQGETVSPGYLGSSSEAFGKDEQGRATYNTGDLGYIQNGLIFFYERRDQQIKLHGYRIDLAEIESAVSHSGLVVEGVCAALKKEQTVKKLVCFVKLRQEDIKKEKAILSQLKVHLREVLPAYMMPHEIIAVADWPLNQNLKKDRTALVKKFFGV